MANETVSLRFRERWRYGAASTDVGRRQQRQPAHVGQSKPVMRVRVRYGRFYHVYREWEGDDINAYIPDEGAEPWQGVWEKPTFDRHHEAFDGDEGYVDLPNVLSCDMEQDYETNGLSRATIVMDNIAMVETLGAMGALYHVVERGYFSPWRGFAARGRTAAGEKNPWYEVLNRNAQILVEQGYGEDEMIPTFVGLVDDIDLTSRPDRITITARDFGQTLTDQRVYGWTVDKHFREPTIFADRRYADRTQDVGFAGGDIPTPGSGEFDPDPPSGAFDPGPSPSRFCSSKQDGHPARFVVDEDPGTEWVSQRRYERDRTEWVQIQLPAGRYSSFRLFAGHGNMQGFVSLRAGAGSKRDGEDLPTGWVDTGAGEVPGDNGGVPYVREIKSTVQERREYRLDANYRLEEGSLLRISFRNLGGSNDHFTAKVVALMGIKRWLSTEARRQEWILVDDISDIVKVVLRWAGFKEWDIESTGAPLKDKIIFNRANTLMEVIQKCCEMTGYTFFLADPSGVENNSLGIPTFRENGAMRRRNRGKVMQTITDKDLLTGVSVKMTDEPLASVIRVRGARVDNNRIGSGGNAGSPGVRFGDKQTRVMYSYFPPWYKAGGESDAWDQVFPDDFTRSRLAGLHKPVIHYEPLAKTELDCEIACYLIAFGQALKSATAVCEIPANPYFELDDQTILQDTGTGMSTRLWIAQRSSTFKAGEDGSWKMTLGGSLVDTPDIQAILAEIRDAVSRETRPT